MGTLDKREHLVATAFNLFYRHGVHAIGINRVLSESGIAKKTLYHYFSSKEELVAATVDYRDRCFLAWMESKLTDVEPGREALNALYRALDDWFNGRDERIQPFHGCFFINVSAEFGDPAHPVHRQCAAHKSRVRALIRAHVERLSRDDEAVTEATETLEMLKEGAIVKAHVSADLDAALKAGKVAERVLDTLTA